MDDNHDCQKIITLIRQEMAVFLRQIANLSQTKSVIDLNLNPQQLPLFPSLIAPSRPIAIIISNSWAKTQSSLTSYQAWQNLLAPGRTWQLLTAPLSEQEINGDVITKASSAALHFLSVTTNRAFLIPEDELNAKYPDRDAFNQAKLRLDIGQKYSLSQFTSKLNHLGYIRHETSLEPGTFSVQGENVQLRPISSSYPYTLTWYRSSVEMIQTGRHKQQSPPSHIIIPPRQLPAATSTIANQLSEFTLISPLYLQPGLQPAFIYDSLHPACDFPLLASQKDSPASQSTIIAFYQNYDRVSQAVNNLNQGQNPPLFCPSPLSNQTLKLTSPNLRLLSEHSLIGKTAASRPISYQAGLKQIANLKPDHPAVHSDHGIGIFEGLKSRTINGQTKDYLVLRYAEGASVSVPVEYAHKVTAYVGDQHPPIQKLGGLSWRKTKAKAAKDAALFAAELLRLAGRREQSTNHAYYIDAELEELLENSFPYDLTSGQIQAWEAIKSDLAKTHAMDRLVVGDVGFGKTELAFRAAMHVAANDYQVALLSPTTLLAEQHTDTFQSRLNDIQAKQNHYSEQPSSPNPRTSRGDPSLNRAPFPLGTLSRFQSVTEKKTIHQKIADGNLKIVIGTHALLAPSLKWHQLGLLIIDEEQRFGVRQKELLKKIRANVDILSLSATPIPRTLSMALADLKQLSIISSPPAGRKSVHTKVMPDRDQIYRQALTVEKNRGGQSYVVTPRISQIAPLTHRLKKLLPNLKFASIHGSLPAQELASVIQQFDTGQIDVLVSSSIIENGLDHPRANTLIVAKSTYFGLSDLYQLRGRIGRRSTQGLAYFLYSQSELTGLQRQRLAALTESARLGSGWSLAQRDLEIRGAGNLLGADQSGTVNAVGVQLYLDLVREAVDLSPGQNHHHDVEISLPFAAFIPAHYIAADSLRTEYYQQLSRASSPDQLDNIYQLLITKYGPLPVEVKNHRLLLQLQLTAAANGIKSITYQTITPSDDDIYHRLKINSDHLPALTARLSPLGTWKTTSDQTYLAVRTLNQKLIRELLTLLKAPSNLPDSSSRKN